MVTCPSIQKSVNRVCTSDLDKRIKIQTSSISASNSPSTRATVAFTTVATVWAMIKTTPITKFIDGVNVANGVTNDFFIRYNSSINLDVELWVEFDSKKFKITGVENIDKEKKFVRLRSIELGDKDIAANQR